MIFPHVLPTLYHSEGMMSVEGYNLLRNDRPVIKRGNLLSQIFQVHHLFQNNVINKYCFEYFFCELSIKLDNILIGCVYKLQSFSSLNAFYEQLQCDWKSRNFDVIDYEKLKFEIDSTNGTYFLKMPLDSWGVSPILTQKIIPTTNLLITSEIIELKKCRDSAFLIWKQNRFDANSIELPQSFKQIGNLVTVKIEPLNVSTSFENTEA